MAIVKNKVKEYRNGSYVRSYTEIDVPASVVKSVGEGVGVISGAIGQAYVNWAEKKQKDIEKTYGKLNDNLIFLSNFKNINNDFDKSIESLQNLSKSNFDKYYKIDKDGEITFNFKHTILAILTYISAFITFVSLFDGLSRNPTMSSDTLFIMIGITFILALVSSVHLFLFKIPITLKKAKKDLEDLASLIEKANLFYITSEFVGALNNYKNKETKSEENFIEKLTFIISSNFKEIDLEKIEEKIKQNIKETNPLNYKAILKSGIISYFITYVILEIYIFSKYPDDYIKAFDLVSDLKYLFISGGIFDTFLNIYFSSIFVVLVFILYKVFTRREKNKKFEEKETMNEIKSQTIYTKSRLFVSSLLYPVLPVVLFFFVFIVNLNNTNKGSLEFYIYEINRDFEISMLVHFISIVVIGFVIFLIRYYIQKNKLKKQQI